MTPGLLGSSNDFQCVGHSASTREPRSRHTGAPTRVGRTSTERGVPRRSDQSLRLVHAVRSASTALRPLVGHPLLKCVWVLPDTLLPPVSHLRSSDSAPVSVHSPHPSREKCLTRTSLTQCGLRPLRVDAGVHTRGLLCRRTVGLRFTSGLLSAEIPELQGPLSQRSMPKRRGSTVAPGEEPTGEE